MKQIQKDNAHHFHFHNRKNIERLEKADLTESDEDDDDDEDDLEVIERQAKKVGWLFLLATIPPEMEVAPLYKRLVHCLYSLSQ